MIGSDIRTFGSDRIRVSDRICLNPYPIHIHSKKSDFIHIHIHYPVNGFFYYLTGSDRVGNPRIRTHLPSLKENSMRGITWPWADHAITTTFGLPMYLIIPFTPLQIILYLQAEALSNYTQTCHPLLDWDKVQKCP